jgi:hypothetical protein
LVSPRTSENVDEAPDASEFPVSTKNRLLTEQDVEGSLDGLLLGLRAKEFLRSIELTLLELEVLVADRHVHDPT